MTSWLRKRVIRDPPHHHQKGVRKWDSCYGSAIRLPENLGRNHSQVYFDRQNETAGHSESQNSMIPFIVWRKEHTTFLCQGPWEIITERKLWGSSGEFFRGLKSLVDTDERWAPGTKPSEHLQRGSPQNELLVREEKWRRRACTADSKREKVRRRPGRKQEGKKHREGQDL